MGGAGKEELHVVVGRGVRTRFSGVPPMLCVTLERALPSLGPSVLICTKWSQTEAAV